MVDEPVTIEVISDDVLLRIFSLCNPLGYVNKFMPPVTWRWHRLAHVCRRWRCLILASPRFLGLILVTGLKRCVTTLDCWPALPIAIWRDTSNPLSLEDEDDVLAGLEHSDRIYEISLPISDSMLAKSATLAWSFPELERLDIGSPLGQITVLPQKFLGGSTPTSHKLRHITLKKICLPTLPQLLLSSRDLMFLSLGPDVFTGEGFIPSDTLASSLSATTRLEFLYITFYPRSDIFKPKQRSTYTGSLRPNLIALPALVDIDFEGPNEYLEDLVSRIHAPLLHHIGVRVSQEGVQSLDISQLSQFLSRTELLRSLPLQTSIGIGDRGFTICHQFGPPPPSWGIISLEVFCDHEFWDVSGVVHFSRQLSPLISSVERVIIQADAIPPTLQDESVTVRWLKLFSPFNSAQEVYIYKVERSYDGIASALQNSTEIGQEVFPALHTLELCGFGTKAPRGIESFVDERRLAGRTIAVHCSTIYYEEPVGDDVTNDG